MLSPSTSTNNRLSSPPVLLVTSTGLDDGVDWRSAAELRIRWERRPGGGAQINTWHLIFATWQKHSSLRNLLFSVSFHNASCFCREAASAVFIGPNTVSMIYAVDSSAQLFFSLAFWEDLNVRRLNYQYVANAVSLFSQQRSQTLPPPQGSPPAASTKSAFSLVQLFQKVRRQLETSN